MSCLREGTLGSIILALVLSTPVSAFAQRTNKFVDTFDQRYPAEQASTPPSPERDDAPQSGAGAQQTQNPKPAEAKKVLKVARATRAIGPKRSTSRLVAVSRSFVDAGTKVLPSEHKSVDYIFQRMYSEWVVIRWASGDCKIWHNDTNLPAGYGWNAVAFATASDKAYLKMTRLYRMGECV
jgi:hypothetical protein